MPVTVRLTDGRTVSFPDGTPQAEMEAALSQVPPLDAAPPPSEKSVGGFFSNAGQDLSDTLSGLAQAVRHPLDTAAGFLRAKDEADAAKLADFHAMQKGDRSGFGLDAMAPVTAFGEEAYARPVSTALALSPMAAPALQAAGPALRSAGLKTLRGAATVMEHPVGAAITGGVTGGLAGGPTGAALGSMTAVGTGPKIARDLRRFVKRVDPPPPKVTPTATPDIVKGMSVFGREPAENAAASARMVRGMSAMRPIPPAGARLTPGSAAPRLEDELVRVVDELRLPSKTGATVPPSHPTGGGVTLPPDVPIPTDKTFRRIAPFAKNARARYRELTTKTILTPQEASELAQLEQIVKTQAQASGMSYAAGGKNP